MHGYGDDGFMTWGWMGVMPLVWIALLGLAIWAGYLVFRSTGADGTRPGPPTAPPLRERETPEEILDRRLAEGSIDPDAYDAARRRLQEHRTA